MNEQKDKVLFAVSDLLRGHFQSSEIARINIGMVFVNWALKHPEFSERSICRSEFRFAKSDGEQFREVAFQVEERYPSIKGVLISLLPNRFEQNISDLNALIEVFCLPHWDDLTAEELKDLFNSIVLDADGQDEVYSTPECIRILMTKLINPKENMKVVDLFSGVGSCLYSVYEAHQNFNPQLYGEEINFDMYGISNMLSIINGIWDMKIANKNVYSDVENAYQDFDIVLMDSPFALSTIFEENIVYKYGLPAKSAADWANYQIALYKLKESGRGIATISVGGLNRSTDSKIRKGIIEDDLIEAVILLPASLYTHTAIPTALMVFNKKKDKVRKNKILMIDASNQFVRRNRKQNTLTNQSIDEIIRLYENWTEKENQSVIVERETLAKNDYNLNASAYLNTIQIDSRLGESITLGDVAEILPGVQVSAEDIELLSRNATHYFLNVRHIQDDGIQYEEDERIRDKKINWYGKYDIQAGDIIMTTKGTTAKAVVVPDDYRPSFISNNLTIIRVNQAKYSPYVLLKYLKSDLGRMVLESVTTGAGVRIINASKLGSIKIPEFEVNKCLQMGEKIKLSTQEYMRQIQDAKRKYDEAEHEILEEMGL